jgi:thiol-disulfide isomerase/thioredoxin
VRTFAMVEEQLMTRQLDDEPRLPTALGASIEVQAQIMAADGNRSEGVLYLREQIDRWKDTSIVTRLYKNLNLLSLEGQPALPLDFTEWIGPRPVPLAELKGKPVVLFLWAHWCPDCKAMGPVLEAAYDKYRDTGLTVVAPTQRFGYVAQRKPAPPDEELAYIAGVRDQYYAWLRNVAVPVSREIYTTYGVSSTPTLVFVDRAGNVSRYNPGKLTAEELDAALKAIVAPAPTAKR